MESPWFLISLKDWDGQSAWKTMQIALPCPKRSTVPALMGLLSSGLSLAQVLAAALSQARSLLPDVTGSLGNGATILSRGLPIVSGPVRPAIAANQAVWRRSCAVRVWRGIIGSAVAGI